ncbi:hypothetical protein PspLS_10718 [Pyricularia sp. CBS 133598]|nr:hypothetical protein PspLS_10718 [Pyricularia sp. CBS 133598]
MFPAARPPPVRSQSRIGSDGDGDGESDEIGGSPGQCGVMASTTVASNSSFVSQQYPGNLHSANLQSQSQGFHGQNSNSSVPSTASFDPPNGSIANTGSQKHHPMSSQQSQPPASQQSFSMSQTGSQPQPSQSSFRSYSDQNVPQQPQEASPIYTAVYSNVEVYEFEVNGVAVMKRIGDSKLNATQILKVAGVEKGKRTKILEKEIQTGEHEKVQGGYGKYQGTWIKYERALEVCRQYGVEELLRPLLEYNRNPDGSVSQANLNTPTKEQAMAAQRKKMYNSGADNRNNNGGGTFFKNISQTAHSAMTAISKARFDSPGPRGRNGPTRAPSFQRQLSTQSIDDFHGGNSQASNFAENFPPQDVNMAFSAGSEPQPGGVNGTEPPRKRQRMDMTPANSFGAFANNSQMQAYADAFPGSPTEPNDSFIYTQHAAANDTLLQQQHDQQTPLQPLPYEQSVEAENKRSMLMSIFMNDGMSEQARVDTLRQIHPRDLDMPIDSQCHTALHWAATLSRMTILRRLIEAGASPFRVNTSGETPLMRACIVTNSHDNDSMPAILDILGNTMEVRDSKERTVLHHIALTSAVSGRSAASRYYLQCLLGWVVRQGAANGGQSNSQTFNGGATTSQSQNGTRLDLGRFMSEMLNAQDSAGDTALNIAARIGNRSIISQLLEVCASPHIANRSGLRPTDFGIGVDSDGAVKTKGDSGGDVENGDVGGSSQKSNESSNEIVTSITHLLTETSANFQEEIKNKQKNIDSLHATLRLTTTDVNDLRRKLDEAQARVKAQQLARQKVTNLQRAEERERYRLTQLEQTTGRRDIASSNGWEAESNTLLATINATTNGEPEADAKLPSSALLRARIEAVKKQTESTRQSVVALKGRSREVEARYRHLVALATKCRDEDVDSTMEGLLKAVESEKGELEIGRVRRFLGGVEGVVG